jgi:hypothetical protein
MTSTTWKASVKWIAWSLLLLPATNTLFFTVTTVVLPPEGHYTWGEAVAELTFTALFLAVMMAPGVVLYLLLLALPGRRLRLGSRRALALLLSPVLGLPLLWGFWTPDPPWELLLLWLGPPLTYALALQRRLAGIPGARAQQPHPARLAPPGGESPP